MNNRFREWTLVVLTGVAGLTALASAILFRDQIPVSMRAARILGFCILYSGMALFMWAAFHLKSAIGGRIEPRLDRLVVAGPYQFVRHPVYLAITIAMIGASIVTRSLLGLLTVGLLFLPVEIRRARIEDRALEEKFGDTWKEYADRTGFFVPRLGGR